MKKLSIGIVVWNDAVSYGGTSGQYDVHVCPHKPLMMYTVGLVIDSTKLGVTLAKEISADADCRGILFIPRGMIIKEQIIAKDVVEIQGAMMKMKMK